jgi:predicted GH43/DUF377 family glycosyl hydrolase
MRNALIFQQKINGRHVRLDRPHSEISPWSIYRLGVALHDRDDPAQIIGIADEWILQPEDPWEITGYVPNVVFTCGAVPEEDGTVKIYWGGADTVMCAGSARITDLVKMCLKNPRPPY